MKVCFFDFTVNFGGGPQGSLYLMHRLQNEGIECYILDAFGVSNEYASKAISYHLDYRVLYKKVKSTTIGYNDRPFLRMLGFIRQTKNFAQVSKGLLKQIKDIQPDVIIVNNEKSLYFAYLAKKIFNFKILLYFRGEGIPSQLSPRFIKSLSSKCDHVVAHSKIAVKNLINAGLVPNHVSYIPNCIETIKKTALNTESFIAKYNSFKIILTSARPVKEKGYHIAIEAVNQLLLEDYKIDLFLPGVSPTGSDKSYENYLASLIKKYNLEESIHLIGWRDNLIADIYASDLVVLPSHTEGFPRSVIESMLVGTPVCATPVGGIPEAIIHRKTGMLFDVDDINGLKDCIMEYIDNPCIYESISDVAKNFSSDYFHPKHNTLGIMEVLKKIN